MGREGEREGREPPCGRDMHRSDLSQTPPRAEGDQPATQVHAPTKNGTSHLSGGRLALNPLSHTSQGGFIPL